jgi:fucose permease
VFGSASLFLPVYFQNSIGVSPTRSGLYVSPFVIGAFFGSFIVGRVISKTGRYKPWPLFSGTSAIIGALGLFRIAPSVPYWQLAVPMFMVGLGAGSTFTTNSVAVQSTCDPKQMGAATATMQFFRQLGGALGAAVAGAIFLTRVKSVISSRLPPEMRGTKIADLIRDPDEVRALPPEVRAAVIDGIAAGTRIVYVLVLAVLAFFMFLAVTMREVRLAPTLSK